MTQPHSPSLALQRPPRSLFVSALAIVSIVIALTLLVNDAISLISYVSLTQSAAYRLVERELEMLEPGSGSAALGSTFTVGLGIIGILLNAGCVGASVGVFLRKGWGRMSYIFLAWFQAVFFLASSVATYIGARSLIERSGVGSLLNGSALFNIAGYALAISAIVAFAVAIFVTRKLSSPEVRAEFLQERRL